jgi:hypothetical protein
MKINLGSGYRRYDGFVNIDDDPLVKPDYLVNIDDVNIRLPFDDNTVEEIKASHILEHIGDGFIPLMKELYRVSSHGAILDIVCPHHTHDVFFGDPTHRRPITVNAMKLFSKKFNQQQIEKFDASSGLGLKYDIDFEVVWFDYKYDSFYDGYINNYKIAESEGKLTVQQQMEYVRLFREANNIATDVMIKMVAVKQ